MNQEWVGVSLEARRTASSASNASPTRSASRVIRSAADGEMPYAVRIWWVQTAWRTF